MLSVKHINFDRAFKNDYGARVKQTKILKTKMSRESGIVLESINIYFHDCSVRVFTVVRNFKYNSSRFNTRLCHHIVINCVLMRFHDRALQNKDVIIADVRMDCCRRRVLSLNFN